MPDSYNPGLTHETIFDFWDSQTPTSLQVIQQGLARAWCLVLASQNDQALTVVEATERQLDNLSPPLIHGIARYRNWSGRLS